MLGSQCKIALEKGAARDKEFTARTAAEVATVMTANLSEKTKQFEEVKIFTVEPFERPLEKPGCMTAAIQKVRHVTRVAGGGLLTREIACVPCLELGTTLCPTCAALPPTWQDPAAAKQPQQQGGEGEEGEEHREDEHREGEEVQGAAATEGALLEEEEEDRGARAGGPWGGDVGQGEAQQVLALPCGPYGHGAGRHHQEVRQRGCQQKYITLYIFKKIPLIPPIKGL